MKTMSYFYSFCYTVVYIVQSIETSKFHTHAVGKFESNVRTHEITLRIFSAKFQRRQRNFIKYETKELSNFRRKFDRCKISSIFVEIRRNSLNFACVTFEQYCKNPCSVCKFNVHNNHKAIYCDICHLWTHLKCTPFSHDEYNALSNSSESWFCPPCTSALFPFNNFEEDTDFYFSLFDFNRIPCFDSELLKTKCFNPFLDDSDSLLLNSDIDPDSNSFKDNSHLLSNCIYLTSNEFNNIPPPSSVSFCLFHINNS